MRPTSSATVFLVDDNAPIRECLKELLALDSGIEIVGEAAGVETALEGIARTHPDFVVLDYRLADGTGLDVLRAIDAATFDTTFIVLTNHASAQVRSACVAAGARFFLDKSSEFDRLVPIIVDRRAAQRI